MSDDRDEFDAQMRARAGEMARDADVQRISIDAFEASDRHGYSYFWRWLGLPIIQTPDDIVAMQEIIWDTQPQVIVETGFARGGSVLLYSTMLELLGEGIVVSVDIEFRDHNRRAVEEHPLGRRVRFVEGSSIDAATIARVQELIPEGALVMVVLDSDHSHAHVLEELRLYGPLVSPGQFLVVSDTIVEDIRPQSHRPRHWGPGDNPKTALDAYLCETDRFEPDPWFNGKLLVTSSRGGYLRCTKPGVIEP